MVKITLANGVVLDNIEINGDNYVSPVEISEATFADGLSKVVISDGESETTYTDMILVQVTKYKNVEGWFFVLREMTAAEKQDKVLAETVATLSKQGDETETAVAELGELVSELL